MKRFAILALLFIAFSSASAQTTRPAETKQIFLIVHGAWGGGWAFRQVEIYMTADGFKVFRPTLTGQGEKFHLSGPEINLTTHINDITNEILYEDMHNVILVGHSYGGMVISGVANKVPDRIKRLVYLDALVPEDGESVDALRKLPNKAPLNVTVENGFLIPVWLRPETPLPRDVPMSAKTFSEPIALNNQAAALKIPTTYVLTVDLGKQPEDDTFFPFYQRAKARGWTMEVMEGDHNVQWSKPKELAAILEKAAK